MKPEVLQCPALSWAVLCTLAGLLAGCGRQPAASTAIADVRGEPIVPSAVAKVRVSTPDASAPVAPDSSVRDALPASSAPAAPTSVASAAKPEPKSSDPSFPLVGFDKLSSYPIELSDELLGPVTNNLAAVTARTEALIPDSVKAFSKKRVSLRGFMLPLKVEGGLVTELLIMKDQSMCCYGTVPKIHEWVSVKMTEKGVKPLMDQPITLLGTLHVGEMRENGYLTGIYRMDGDRMGAVDE
jgi:hypothetical protein